MKSKALKLFGVLVVVSMILVGCGQPAATSAPAQPAATSAPAQPAATQAPAAEKELKIGLIAPYTGPNALVGQEFKDIHEMAFGEINWKIGDYKIVPVYIDDESDPEKAVSALKAAILEQHIVAATAGYHSSVTLALMDIFAQNKIPYFFPQNESSVIVDKFKSDPAKYAYIAWKGRPSPTKLIVGYDAALFKEAIDKGT